MSEFRTFTRALIDSSLNVSTPKEKVMAAFEVLKDKQMCDQALEAEAIDWYNTHHKMPRLERQQMVESRAAEQQMVFDEYKATKKVSALHTLATMKKFKDTLIEDSGVWTKYPF